VAATPLMNSFSAARRSIAGSNKCGPDVTLRGTFMACSSVTDRAVGEMFVVEILMREDDPALGLIIGKFPEGIENPVSRSHVRCRIAVAIEAPSHGERRSLSYQRHARDGAMTGCAADAFC